MFRILTIYNPNITPTGLLILLDFNDEIFLDAKKTRVGKIQSKIFKCKSP